LILEDLLYSPLGGWGLATSASDFDSFGSQAGAVADALVAAGRGAAGPLRDYAAALEQAQRRYAATEEAAQDSDRAADRAEDGSRAQSEARERVRAAQEAVTSARVAALAANERAAAAIGGLLGSVPPAPPAPSAPMAPAAGGGLNPFIGLGADFAFGSAQYGLGTAGGWRSTYLRPPTIAGFGAYARAPNGSYIAGARAYQRFGLEPGQGLRAGSMQAFGRGGGQLGAGWHASGYHVLERPRRPASARPRGGPGAPAARRAS